MNALNELKNLVSLEKITSIIYSDNKGSLEYSIPETLELLKVTNLDDVPEELTFNGKDFKIIITKNEYDLNKFTYISFKKETFIKVVPEVLTPQYWSKKYNRLLPYKDENYLFEEREESKRKFKIAIEEVENKRKKFKEKIQSCYLKNTSTLKPFSIFEEYGNYYIVLPKGIEFDNSVGIFNNSEFSSYKLSQLSKFALYEKANPELAKATLDYHKEYTKLVKNLIKEGFVFPVLGISWTKAMETDKSTKELIEIVAKELKELL